MTPTITVAQAAERNGYLTTTGRRTGNPHEIEIWFAVAGDHSAILLLSGGGASKDWIRNIDADPAVTFRIGDTTLRGTGRRARAAEDQPIREALSTKYYAWTGGELPNQWAKTALPIVIDLEGPAR